MELLKIQFQLTKFYFTVWLKFFFLKKSLRPFQKIPSGSNAMLWQNTEGGGSGGQNLRTHLYIDAGKANTSEDWYLYMAYRRWNIESSNQRRYKLQCWNLDLKALVMIDRGWVGSPWGRSGQLRSHGRGCFSANPRCHSISTTVKAHWFLLATCQLCLQTSVPILYLTFSSVRFWSFWQLTWRAHLPSVCFLLSGPQEGCLSSVTYASMIPLQMLQNYLRLVGGPARWSLMLPAPPWISWLLSFMLRAMWAPPPAVPWPHDLSRAPSLENCWYLAWKLLVPRDCLWLANCYNLGRRRVSFPNKDLALSNCSLIWKRMTVVIKMPGCELCLAVNPTQFKIAKIC